MLKFYLLMLYFIPLVVCSQMKGALQGTVYNDDGRPILASVRLSPDNYFVQVKSDGSFKINDLYEGIYTITVSHIGYKNLEQSVEIVPEKTSYVNIKLTADAHALNEVAVDDKLVQPDNLISAANSAMPVTVITRRQIELMGSRRLDEVLKEQTGIAVVNNIAGGNRSVGVQLQGFSSAYVMILIDGQPMVGRDGGSFDLSRISVTNIERVEIIKGAASCLFGSEAMGGAINIVTRHGALQAQGLASVRYGSLNTLDATLEGETPFVANRGEASLSANFYRSDGFNVNSRYQTRGTTVPPSNNYTLQGRSRYRLARNTTIGVSGRYGLRKSVMTRGYGNEVYEDHMDEGDFNASAYLNTTGRDGLQALSRFYFTNYSWNSGIEWQQGRRGEQSRFIQSIYRLEQQFVYNRFVDLSLTGGLGSTLETMDDRSLGDVPSMENGFFYGQAEWRADEKLQILGGGRYDYHADYGGRVSPNLGLTYMPMRFLTIKVALGAGFKTPDFRQRFQVFTNPLVGYTVLGADIARKQLSDMQADGQLSELRNYTFNKLQQDGLQPEQSNTFNLTVTVNPSSSWRTELSAFYHQIKNQINSFQVATATDGQMIYSYLNLPKVNNKGIEASISHKPLPNFDISIGYQYLAAKDQSVRDSIIAGNWPYSSLRNPATGETFRSQPSDYWGLENRSRHMANLRIFYYHQPWDMGLTFRINYRGKYPFEDTNGNFYIDRYDTFVAGFFLFNASIEKKIFKKHLALQVTAENITNYTDFLMPGQLGRVVLAGLTYRFF
ncbi:TonB-dependent receptor [Olivibacter sp. XZL3]|uniref:TonB-dependent receptor n=1 Tax=Olivibacter sp. XZL3 TaxID=1735116 RepID=UPI0010662ECC|nr:TonB-dependent receptor [Olivibacter sp. XZL3]